MYSIEHKKYLNNIKKKKYLIIFLQIAIFLLFILFWQILANYKIINTFIFSSPKKILYTIINLYNKKMLFNNIWVTIYETILSFSIATILGTLIATILWWNKTIQRIIDPYLTILNSLPKVALGPIIIIWFGSGIKSIIFMALLISLIITIINVYEGFNNIDNYKIKLMKSFGASKLQLFYKLIFPGSLNCIMNALKINISMSLIGLLPPVGEKIFFNKCYSRYLFHYHLL